MENGNRIHRRIYRKQRLNKSNKTIQNEKSWTVFTEYYKNGKKIAVQYKIPIEQRRSAERMFQTKLKD